MKPSKAFPIFLFILFFFGMGGLFNFSRDVRAVNVVGLFFSGMTAGAAIVGIVLTLRARAKI